MQKLTRSEAKAQGLTRYFTGKPCKHGHVEERIVSSGACMACHKARRLDWEKRNAERINASSRARHAENPYRRRAAQERYTTKNGPRVAELKRSWRQRNAEKIKLKNAKWLAENKATMRQINADWYRLNKDIARARDVRRRVGLRLSHAVWDRELTSLVTNEAADLADRRQAITGFGWHIDHMIPLRSKKASGLHVWSNLQVIPASLNAKKGSRLILTAPGEWIAHL